MPHYTSHTHCMAFNIRHWFITEKESIEGNKLFYSHKCSLNLLAVARHTHSVDLKGQILTKFTVKNIGLKKKKVGLTIYATFRSLKRFGAISCAILPLVLQYILSCFISIQYVNQCLMLLSFRIRKQ